MLKNKIRLYDLIPPILPRVYQKLVAAKKEKEYENFKDALSDCRGTSYEDIELCNVVAEKTKKYKDSLLREKPLLPPTSILPLVSAIGHCLLVQNKQTLNILDIGGACGAHYFEVRHLIPQNIKINWIVLETPQMVLSAKNQGLPTEELHFIDSLEMLDAPIDFVHSSGTLQYVAEPYSLLEQVVNLGATYLFFNRMMLNKENREFITVQKSKLSWNGPGKLPEKYQDRTVFYPHTTLSFQKLNEKLSNKYILAWELDEKTGKYQIGNGKITGRALLYIKQSRN